MSITNAALRPPGVPRPAAVPRGPVPLGAAIARGRRRVRAWLLLVAFGLTALMALTAPRDGAAAELARAEVRAVRSTVEAQLDAMAAGDAERAFSYASPAIRSQFGSAATFMEMVRRGYPMVLRPAAKAFFQPESVDGVVLQRVRLRDREGRSWIATYQLVAQPDRSWRINGCVVAADDDKSSV